MDTDLSNVQTHAENAVILEPWRGDSLDTDLVSFVPFLEHVAATQVSDVRKVLATFNGEHIPSEYRRREKIERAKYAQEMAEQRATEARGSALRRWTCALGLDRQNFMTIDGMTPVLDQLADGKMLVDQIRERGRKNYEAMEAAIRESGPAMLQEQAEAERQIAEEQRQNMKGWMAAVWTWTKPAPGE